MPVPVSAPVTDLTTNTTYHLRIVATNSAGTSYGDDVTFTPRIPEAPQVLTEAASSIGLTTAILNATVTPNGQAVSSCRFEYGTTTSYGSTASCAALPGSGETAVPVSAAVKTLGEDTTYHFRIVATSSAGTSYGADETLKTIYPVVTSEAAEAITPSTAIVTAIVNPNGGAVSDCHFEYGTTISYGSSSAQCTPMPGSGTSPVGVSASLVGLALGTTYHFRISAASEAGTSKGSDQTFTTRGSAVKCDAGPRIRLRLAFSKCCPGSSLEGLVQVR